MEASGNKGKRLDVVSETGALAELYARRRHRSRHTGFTWTPRERLDEGSLGTGRQFDLSQIKAWELFVQ